MIISLEVYIKLSNFNLQDFRKRAVLLPSDSKSKGWEKIGNFRGLQTVFGGNLKIQVDPIQFSGIK